ncbi:MAG: hypothetical protein KQH79_10195 [Bacteroidetes bacterium]|nr:hypothetical protein [Bacteroidota bacterium]
MKKDHVPQNKNNLHKGTYKTVVYAVDDNGEYVKVKTSGWEPEDIAHEQAWEQINKRIEDTKKQILQGELSPLAYYMEKSIMTPKRLAAMAELPVRKVKRHLKPKRFRKLKEKYLTIYAQVFDITVEDLTNFK